MRAMRLLVSGQVQGVGYRAWARREGAALGLSGWVRNLRDGRVEALAASADEARLQAFTDALWKGPWSASVERVEVLPAEPPEDDGFQIRPTA